MGLFAHLVKAPDDPILGLVATFNKDDRQHKIDLTVGVYKNEQGVPENFTSVAKAQLAVADYFFNLPSMQAPAGVTLSEENLAQVKDIVLPPGVTIGYLPTSGYKPFTDGLRELVYPVDKVQAAKDGRIVSMESVAGSGGLSAVAHFLKEKTAINKVFISDPTWSNHFTLFGKTGLATPAYPYYDEEQKGINFSKTLAFFKENLDANSAVLFHASCHNPCGCDFSSEEWRAVLEVLKEKDALAVFDLAYQGFGEGLDADVYGVRYAADLLPESICIQSCSKSFGMYGERIGVVHIVGQTPEAAQAASSNLQNVAANYYVAPTSNGAYVVSTVLTNPALRAEWEEELKKICERLTKNRQLLVDALEALGHPEFKFLLKQKGMFSYTGLTAPQVVRLRDEHAVYLVENGRINVCGINPQNVQAIAEAFAKVL